MRTGSAFAAVAAAGAQWRVEGAGGGDRARDPAACTPNQRPDSRRYACR